MVPTGMSSLPANFFSFLTVAMTSRISVRRMSSSFRVPISGTMISGRASIFFFLQAIAASVMARACMAAISGYVIARRQPR
jgi:hypothetical protein